MQMRTVTVLVILVTAAALVGLNEFDWLDYLARYVFIFLMGFYFLGQFTQRRFKS
ncbi:MAG: hypothetical protein OSA37_08575 [Flavobacteriales bacterium]|nr:hypothetical protein [Flavobacteriales bacterium]